MVSSSHQYFYLLDLMPNISMIEKVVQQVYPIDYLVSNYTFMLVYNILVFFIIYTLLFLLLLLKEVGSAKMGEIFLHPVYQSDR